MILIRYLLPLVFYQQVVEHARENVANRIGRYGSHKVEHHLDVFYTNRNSDNDSEET